MAGFECGFVPTVLATVRATVGETDTGADFAADGGGLAGTVVEVLINSGEMVGARIRRTVRIDVAVGVIDMAVGVGGGPGVVGAGDKHGLAEIRRIRHGVLLVHQNLVYLVLQLGGVCGGKTTVVAVWNVVISS